MARRRHSGEESNMDSLLDALTNVVGILLLVLIITSLNMNEAVRKILSEINPVTPEQFQANKILRDRKLTELKELKSSVQSFQAPDQITQQLAELDLELDGLKTDSSVASLQDQLAAIQAKIEEEEARKKIAEENVSTASTELNRLIALLQGISDLTGPPPKIVTIPAGREARDDSEPRFVLCLGNRAYWIGDFYGHTSNVRIEIEANFASLVYSGDQPGAYTYAFRSDSWLRDSNRFDELRPRNVDGLVFRRFRYDGKKILKHFQDNESRIGTPDITYHLAETGDRLRLSVGPRSGGGLSPEDLSRPGSRLMEGYRETFRDPQGKQHYLYFIVAPDSFDVYLEARRIADERQIANGWRPWAPGEAPRIPAQINEATFRQFLPYEVAGIPMDALTSHAQKVLPALRLHMENADKAVAAVTDPPLRLEVNRWAGTFKGTYFDVERHIPQATPLLRGTVTVLAEPQLPEIPLIRIFTPAPPQPTEVPKREPPRPPAPQKVVRDILD